MFFRKIRETIDAIRGTTVNTVHAEQVQQFCSQPFNARFNTTGCLTSTTNAISIEPPPPPPPNITIISEL